MNFLNIQLPLLSNIYPKKKVGKEYINTSIKDIYKKHTKHFQDPTRDDDALSPGRDQGNKNKTRGLLDPMFEFVRWCPCLELGPL